MQKYLCEKKIDVKSCKIFDIKRQKFWCKNAKISV